MPHARLIHPEDREESDYRLIVRKTAFSHRSCTSTKLASEKDRPRAFLFAALD